MEYLDDILPLIIRKQNLLEHKCIRLATFFFILFFVSLQDKGFN